MPEAALHECVFYIPQRRDKDLSDGEVHSIDAWEWLDDRLYEEFDGLTIAPGWNKGFWHDPDTHTRVSDLSAQYTVAISARRLKILKDILVEACDRFEQKAIYLSVRGQVQFIRRQES
jgi:hypothetical protein